MSSAAKRPQVIVIGGPNGAGKSTAATGILKNLLAVGEFVNADVIASGLAAYAPEKAAMAAGRIMLARIHELAVIGDHFAFETTLASRSFAPFLADLRSKRGYVINLVFLYVHSPEIAVRRVRQRVKMGGHSVPEEVIRRRYDRGIANFINLYLPLADYFRVYDNSAVRRPKLIAQSLDGKAPRIVDQSAWNHILEIAQSHG